MGFLLSACPCLEIRNEATDKVSTVPVIMELILGEGGKHVKTVLNGQSVGRRGEQGVLLGRGDNFK